MPPLPRYTFDDLQQMASETRPIAFMPAPDVDRLIARHQGRVDRLLDIIKDLDARGVETSSARRRPDVDGVYVCYERHVDDPTRLCVVALRLDQADAWVAEAASSRWWVMQPVLVAPQEEIRIAQPQL